MIWTIIIISTAFVLSAFFSGIESAYLSTNKLGIEVLKNKGSNKGKILTEIYNDPRSFLNMTLLGNNLAFVVLTLILSPILFVFIQERIYAESWMITIFITLILTILIFIFCEYLPKAIFRYYANEAIYRFAYPLSVFRWLLAIPSIVVNFISGAVLSMVSTPVDLRTNSQVSKMDLEHYITHKVSEEKDIDKEILNNALNLSHQKVKECMIPRNEIIFVDKNDDIQTVRQAFIDSKLSRMIVVDGDIENIVGYLHHQQLFKNITNIKRHIMEISFIPDVMNAQTLMHNFMKTGTNIACVVNEFGGTAGIITLEDILEEIFGEISDEHDEEDFIEMVLGDGEYMFSGRLEIGYLNDTYGLDLPDEDYITLSGYIVMTHGNIPQEGDCINFGQYTFEIMTKSDTKIELLRMKKNRQESRSSDSKVESGS